MPAESIKILGARFEGLPKSVRFLAVLGLTCAIIWLDLATASYIVITGLYLFPVFLAAWYCGPSATFVVSLISLLVNLYVSSTNFPASFKYWELVLSDMSLGLIFVAFAIEVVYLKNTFDKLHKESRTDQLTGVRNRRSFLEEMEVEMARAKRCGQPFSVAMVDLDNFKRINDTQGHLKGDELLVAVGGCLMNSLREVDLVGRYGGDEFIMLLPNTNLDEAGTVLTRLHHNLQVLIKSYDRLVSASIGAGTVQPELGQGMTEIVAKIDGLMYSVKNSTKDSLTLAQL